MPGTNQGGGGSDGYDPREATALEMLGRECINVALGVYLRFPSAYADLITALMNAKAAMESVSPSGKGDECPGGMILCAPNMCCFPKVPPGAEALGSTRPDPAISNQALKREAKSGGLPDDPQYRKP